MSDQECACGGTGADGCVTMAYVLEAHSVGLARLYEWAVLNSATLRVDTQYGVHDVVLGHHGRKYRARNGNLDFACAQVWADVEHGTVRGVPTPPPVTAAPRPPDTARALPPPAPLALPAPIAEPDFAAVLAEAIEVQGREVVRVR